MSDISPEREVPKEEPFNHNLMKYVNEHIQKRFDGIAPDPNNLPTFSSILAAPGQRILEFDFRNGSHIPF